MFLQVGAAWLCARTARFWPVAVLTAAAVVQAGAGAAMVGFVRL
jgi:hypothetical protein